jgi:hypothetical protein
MYRAVRAIEIDRSFQAVPRSKSKPTNLSGGPNRLSLDGVGVALAGATSLRSKFQL